MRGFAFFLAVATINVVAPGAFAQTSVVTNCMMGCNARAANCQTACLLPPPPASSAAATNITTTPNSTANTTCVLNCSTTQLACQTNCGLQSPSQ